MENKREIKPVLEYTNDAGMQEFREGDAVICFAKSKVYRGTIVAFCDYKENEDADSQCSVYLDTSKNSMSRSCEIINIADITYICGVPMGGLAGYPKTNEKLDRDNFINMIVALGYDREYAEIMYRHMEELIALYNIPLSSILASAIQEVNLCTEGMCQDELIKILYNFMDIMVERFQSVTDIVRESWKNEIASRDEKQY